jgi:hypothetical protein
VLRLVLRNPNLLVPHYLMHSYAYYVQDDPIVSDATFDTLVVLLEDHWERIEHRHKDLLDRTLLKSGFHLQYPSIVIGATEHLRSCFR